MFKVLHRMTVLLSNLPLFGVFAEMHLSWNAWIKGPSITYPWVKNVPALRNNPAVRDGMN
jgi:hypothetical protein